MTDQRPQYYETGARDASNRLIWYPVPRPIPLHETLVGVLCNALAYTDGRRTRAAQLLGITPHVLGQLIRHHGVPVDRIKPGGGRPKRVPIVALVAVLWLLAPAAFAQSPDNTRIPPVTSLTDCAGAVWTFGVGVAPSRVVLRNGTPAAGGLGTLIVLWKCAVTVQGNDAQWYRYDAAANGWTLIGADPTLPTGTLIEPVGVAVLVLPPGTDPAVPALATRTTPIAKTSLNCNQAPWTGVLPALPLVNPTTVVLDDPWTPGRTCRALLPPGLPVGANFRVAVQFVTAPGTTCGVTPCVSARGVVVDPFSSAVLWLAPAAPSGTALRP